MAGTYAKKYSLGYAKDGFFRTYARVRQGVGMRQIIGRVTKAYEFLKIAAVKDNEES